VSLDRKRGVLFGQAAGDAVGTTQEFHRPSSVRPFPELNDAPQKDMVGGGPFNLEPGQITDDTHMAICLAESLADRGAYDPQDAAARYVEWSRRAFDIGNQTRSALSAVSRHPNAIDAGFAIWEAAGRKPAANGALMRCSPIPVFFASDRVAMMRAAILDAAITHADPRCRLASCAFTSAIACAIEDERARPSEMFGAAREGLDQGRELVAAEGRTPSELVDEARTVLLEDLALAEKDDPLLYGSEVDLIRAQGFVRVAFRLAFWELHHAPSFEAAVLDCANRGGDADTNGAIAGALYGALAGEAGIPASWREKVLSACAKKAEAWADTYHPRRLFRVLGK
jgi:ADP-ribosyl-[dinitrogen reductase] hydrolase